MLSFPVSKLFKPLFLVQVSREWQLFVSPSSHYISPFPFCLILLSPSSSNLVSRLAVCPHFPSSFLCLFLLSIYALISFPSLSLSCAVSSSIASSSVNELACLPCLPHDLGHAHPCQSSFPFVQPCLMSLTCLPSSNLPCSPFESRLLSFII